MFSALNLAMKHSLQLELLLPTGYTGGWEKFGLSASPTFELCEKGWARKILALLGTYYYCVSLFLVALGLLWLGSPHPFSQT